MVIFGLVAIASAIELTRCYPNRLREEAYCGTHTVLENRSAPTGKKIALHLLVLPAVKANPESDPLFVLAGGPGQGATEVASTMMPMLRFLHQDRTIVFLDQRGTGSSNPLDCQFEDPNSSDVPKEELLNCLKTLQVDTTQYSTEILAKDTDEVRKALGYERINLYGASYGTRLGLIYIRDYPERVRSAVLDGVAPPQIAIGGDFGEYAQRALDSIFADCIKDEECGTAFPLLEKRFYVMLDSLQEPKNVNLPHPITYELERFEITKELVLGTVQQLLYDPMTSSLLPYVITAAYDENWAPLIALGHQGLGEISIGLYLSIVCAEDVPLIDYQSHETFAMGSHLTEELREMCSVWPSATISPSFYQPVHSAVPILLLSGQNDPVTPPENAEKALLSLSNASHIVVPGMAHNTLRTDCLLQLFRNFVNTLSTKEIDQACVQDHQRPPFVLSPSGTSP